MTCIVRCNHCGKSHWDNYCPKTGKIPSPDCPEDDIDPTPYDVGLPENPSTQYRNPKRLNFT
jgi:hypothetical protein